MALILNTPIISLILISNMKNVHFTLLTIFYLGCVIIGYYILPILLICSLLFLIFYPVRVVSRVTLTVAMTIFVYYFLIDHLAFVVAKIHIDLFWMEAIAHDFGSFGLPESTLRNIFIVLLAIIGLEIGIFQIARRVPKPRFMVTAISLLAISGLGVSQGVHIIAYEKNDGRITQVTPCLPIYVPIISRREAIKYGRMLPLGENDERFGSERNTAMRYPLKELSFDPSAGARNPNIIIVLLESWRFDTMNETVSPNMFGLSRNSSVFDRHFSSGNSTVAGVFGLFYGLDPTYWTAVKANSGMIDNPVLIDVLKNKGYSFGIFARSNFNRHKIKDTVFNGIEVHEDFAGGNLMEQDADMTRQLISFIRAQAGGTTPYAALAFYKSTHFPYQYPPEDSVFLPAEDINLMFAGDNTDPKYYFNDYRNSVHYVDRLIEEVLGEIDSLGEMGNTVILITGDHSDELNDNRANYWGHGSDFTEYQTMTPLIIYIPGRSPRRIDYVTSHVDIAPTLLRDVFGCTNDFGDFSNGRDLFAEPGPEPRPLVIGNYINHAFVIGDDVYEIWPIYTKKYKLDNIRLQASNPSPAMLKTIMEGINRFYDDPAPVG